MPSLWAAWSISQCPGDNCEGGSSPEHRQQHHHPSPRTRITLRPGLKAFPLAASLDAFCRKIKHHEKIKPCHFPLQIIQGCNEKESIKAEHLGCKVFPVVSMGNSYKTLALSQPQHHLHSLRCPRGPGCASLMVKANESQRKRKISMKEFAEQSEKSPLTVCAQSVPSPASAPETLSQTVSAGAARDRAPGEEGTSPGHPAHPAEAAGTG